MEPLGGSFEGLLREMPWLIDRDSLLACPGLTCAICMLSVTGLMLLVILIGRVGQSHCRLFSGSRRHKDRGAVLESRGNPRVSVAWGQRRIEEGLVLCLLTLALPLCSCLWGLLGLGLHPGCGHAGSKPPGPMMYWFARRGGTPWDKLGGALPGNKKYNIDMIYGH
ncbi:hypothetical protein EYF80_027172 [Liparis tanakae]|uniref:Uncharacterized protein n=1 Tax=Liparis tanakae TaxID=230148 RepID=A0A4Z2HC35_9TELE|nr:hypothetical protein EYF80_027172 [Liparis tanakae]